ncbi:MAG: sugar ABC transporter permease, partial [Planctomycetes bacterium]|nr:sugar ABC transporter permease [Planctomycetota bacterium]
MALNEKDRRNMMLGLAFLGPNIFGFLFFTVLPLILSLVLAFSNWDLKLHNMFREETIEFAGIENFTRLFADPKFLQYFGNTLFFMMGIPFGIIGSLGAAMLLSQELKGKNNRVFGMLIAGAVLFASTVMLTAIGMGATALTLLVLGLGGIFLVGGVIGGSTVYRTLFFIPNFTSGVAVYILWKKLYNPQTGPINNALAGPLDSLGKMINGIPGEVVHGGMWACFAVVALVFGYGFYKMRCMLKDGAIGWLSMVLGGVF